MKYRVDKPTYERAAYWYHGICEQLGGGDALAQRDAVQKLKASRQLIALPSEAVMQEVIQIAEQNGFSFTPPMQKNKMVAVNNLKAIAVMRASFEAEFGAMLYETEFVQLSETWAMLISKYGDAKARQMMREVWTDVDDETKTLLNAAYKNSFVSLTN